MAHPVQLAPANMKVIGSVDERYQSFNIEMLEVTGGRFWKPYGSARNATSSGAGEMARTAPGSKGKGDEEDVPSGMDPALFEYRAAIDLAHPRLRLLASALGPIYLRISGTWANSTYFADTDSPPASPPEGFNSVLTRQQWLAAIAFSRAVDAPIVTSMAVSEGTRDDNAVWQPDHAREWLAFTKRHGGAIAAAEYFNEPTMATMGGAPQGYSAADFGRDFGIFQAMMRREFPDTALLGPGSVGEADADWAVASGGYGSFHILKADDLASYTRDADAFSYHHYGAVSLRCAPMGHQTSPEQALSEEWLARTDQTLAYYRRVRDQWMPGKHFWNTETGETACGGNPWAGTFLDTFRYLDQLGRLARQEVDVVLHNTLAASDYSVINEGDFSPKPSYWGALLWRRLMGTTVLDTGFTNGPGLHVYAHSLRGAAGGVALLVLNTDRAASRTLAIPVAAERFTLAATSLTDRSVTLNGTPLELDGDALPAVAGKPVEAGEPTFAPATITFLAIPGAQNEASL